MRECITLNYRSPGPVVPSLKLMEFQNMSRDNRSCYVSYLYSKVRAIGGLVYENMLGVLHLMSCL